jgi:hypothetical protein
MVIKNWRGFKGRILQVAQEPFEHVKTFGRGPFVERTYFSYS